MRPEIAALQICLHTHTPVFLWGEPGVGKTASTEALAKAMQERLWTVILSIREPSDQGGLPVVHSDGSVFMAPPRWAKELAEVGHGHVFLDEMNVSPPTVQNSALRVVNEGYAGDQKLPVTTSFVSAGNPPETNPGVYDLTPAMGNRHCHIEFPLDHAEWCEGMIAGWPTPHIIKLPETWRDGIAAVRGQYVVAFIRRRPQLLHVKPDSPTAAGKAWPSPRTWEMLATLLAAAKAAGYDVKSEVGLLLVRGCVGEGALTEFKTWITNLDLRDPEEYLADPLNVPLPARQDQLMATLDGIAAAALDSSHKEKVRIARYYAAWKVLGRILRDKGDVAIPAARTLAMNMPAAVDDALPPECEDILPMLEAADIDFSRNAALHRT